mmetsp:Transcript_51060/g.163412  ORF Transcript_51060/g.163412 Transcript_51060/m.163412 type:complete len:939 (-) Transcript_51060:118-2934(-)
MMGTQRGSGTGGSTASLASESGLVSTEDGATVSCDGALEGIALDREKAKADLLKVTTPMRRRLLASLGDVIKGGMLADPDMWPGIRSGAKAALDRMWADIEHELERNLHLTILQQQADADAAGPSGSMVCNIWLRFRAFLMHHYLPHNRYIFGKLKDPVYLLIYIATLIPIHGVRVAVFSMILLMIIFPGPPDEYQLINYILLFKGMQFLTSGLIAMAMGALKYFRCYSLHKDSLLQCIDTTGPGASDSLGQLADYLGSITLVWIAFSLLPSSKRCTHEAPLIPTVASLDEEGAGGRLRHLLFYDMKCFAASFMLLGLLTGVTCADHFWGGNSTQSLFADPQFCANVFWCCVLYSILSLPFASFAIPGWQAVLTHSDPTGYNRFGACVAFGLSPAGSTEEAEEAEESGMGLVHLASVAANVLSVMERGREARGNYQLGDLGRGLWYWLIGKPVSQDSRVDCGESRQEEGMAGSVAGFMHSIAVTGRQAWGEEAEGDCSFRDFGRGLWYTLRNGQAGKGAGDHLPATELPLAVASVRILAEATEQREGVIFFCTEVLAEGSLDAEGGGEPWQVMRRYTDFHELSSRLGPRSQSYEDAAFPRKHITACTDAMLEVRRRSLEAWLQRVLQDPLSQAVWAGHLREFLEAGPSATASISGSSRSRVLGGEAPRMEWAANSHEPGTMVPSMASTEWKVPSSALPAWKPEQPSASASASGLAQAPVSCSSLEAPAQSVEPAAPEAEPAAREQDSWSDSQTCEDENEEDRDSLASFLGDLLGSVTAAGREALGSEAQVEHWKGLGHGLWTAFRRGPGSTSQEATLGLPVEAGGPPGAMCEPLLWAAAPDPGAMIPATPLAEPESWPAPQAWRHRSVTPRHARGFLAGLADGSTTATGSQAVGKPTENCDAAVAVGAASVTPEGYDCESSTMLSGVAHLPVLAATGV